MGRRKRPRPGSSLRWTVSLGGHQVTLVWTSWLGFFGTCRSSLAGPGRDHEAAAATVTSTWKGNSETRSGGWAWGSCRNVAWASGVAQSGGDTRLALALTHHQHGPNLEEVAAEEIKLPREKGHVCARVGTNRTLFL